eukprot:12821135-Alexandrium_andersonii.AAC.1
MRAAVRPRASRKGPRNVSKAPSSAVDMTATPSGCHGATPLVGSSPPAGEKAALGGLNLQAGERQLRDHARPAQCEVS